jgi:hypothetical protein
MKPLTTKLNNGRVVLAKLYKGEPSAVTYSNRTQAVKKVAELGPGWDVRQFGRPFYVAVAPAHPLGVPCPMCAMPGDIFPAVHHRGPPCLTCHTDMDAIGDRANPYWRCPKCGEVLPVDQGP